MRKRFGIHPICSFLQTNAAGTRSQEEKLQKQFYGYSSTDGISIQMMLSNTCLIANESLYVQQSQTGTWWYLPVTPTSLVFPFSLLLLSLVTRSGISHVTTHSLHGGFGCVSIPHFDGSVCRSVCSSHAAARLSPNCISNETTLAGKTLCWGTSGTRWLIFEIETEIKIRRDFVTKAEWNIVTWKGI